MCSWVIFYYSIWLSFVFKNAYHVCIIQNVTQSFQKSPPQNFRNIWKTSPGRADDANQKFFRLPPNREKIVKNSKMLFPVDSDQTASSYYLI